MRFITLLKSILLICIGFIIGIFFGWNKLAPFNALFSEPTKDTHASLRHIDNPKLTTAAQKPNQPLDIPQLTVQLIQNQQIGPAIILLRQIDIERDENAVIKQLLFENLTIIRNSENWQLLNEWLMNLMTLGMNDSYLYQLQSDVLINNKEYEAALEALHIAIQNAPSITIEDEINQKIDQLITRLSNDYLSGNNDISYSETLVILESAREKRPDNPLISMLLAKLYASQNQIIKAISILELLPYGSNFDASLDTLKQQLTAQLNNETMQKTGIPLIKQGSQYIVKVLINNQVTLYLLLDTGASYTALSSEAIERIHSETEGIYFQNKVTWVNTANGRIQSRIYTTQTLAVQSFILNDANILEASFDITSRVDGLLGMDFLSHFQFKLDYDNDMLYLTPEP